MLEDSDNRRLKKIQVLQERKLTKLTNFLKQMTNSAFPKIGHKEAPVVHKNHSLGLERRKSFKIVSKDASREAAEAQNRSTITMKRVSISIAGSKRSISPQSKHQALKALKSRYAKLTTEHFMKKPARLLSERPDFGDKFEDLPITKEEVIHFCRFLEKSEGQASVSLSKLQQACGVK